jgi:hypothetical protein
MIGAAKAWESFLETAITKEGFETPLICNHTVREQNCEIIDTINPMP